jgi:hypothetical protein
VIAFWSLPHNDGPASTVNLLGLGSIAWFVGVAAWLIGWGRLARPAA